MKKLILLLISFGIYFMPCKTFGQVPKEGTIVGQVIRIVSRVCNSEPVPNCTLTLTGGNTMIRILADSNGYFKFSHCNPGEYDMQAETPGMVKKQIKLFIDSGTLARRIVLIMDSVEAGPLLNGLSINGSRGDGTVYYIDGIRSNSNAITPGAVSMPQNSIEQTTRFSRFNKDQTSTTITLKKQNMPVMGIGTLTKIKRNRIKSDYKKCAPWAKTLPRLEKSKINVIENGQTPKIFENQWQLSKNEPFSTFSTDVDKASYSVIRRSLNEGRLPEPESVRIEEMINYFSYNYPQPKDSQPVNMHLEQSICPWNPAHKLILIGMKAKEMVQDSIPPLNFVFLVDVSGSMQSYDKLPLVKKSLHALVKRLRKKDRVALVAYAGNAGLILPSTPGYLKGDIESAIENLEAGGSTAGGEGINLAYKIAIDNYIKNGQNRVILATDGDFNVGIQSENDLIRLIEEKRKSGIFLTVLGYGTDNYMDEKMQALADHGNGNHAYIDNEKEAIKVLVKDFAGTMLTVAKDVKLQLEWNPEAVNSYRLIGYENRILAKEDFTNDKKDAGEIGAGQTVTALYEVIPADSNAKLNNNLKTVLTNSKFPVGEMFHINMRYKNPDNRQSKLAVFPLKDSTQTFSGASPTLRWAACVASFGMLLKGSQFAGNATYENILPQISAAKCEDIDGYKNEFIELVTTAGNLNRQLAQGAK